MDDFENENYYSKFISSSKDDEERFVTSSRIESDDVIENVIVKSNGQIAEPILLIENDPSIDITANNNEGIYNFAIKNYNEQDKITDIKLKYYIEILANVDNSVQIDLFNNEDKIELNDNKTDYIEVSNDEKEEKQYQIKIKYEKEKSESVSEIMEKIQVKVHTEQVKA